MPDIVYGADQRLIGATCPVAAHAQTRIVVANPLLKQLVTVAISGTAPNVAQSQIEVQASSALLAAAPRAVAVSGGWVSTIATDLLAYRADGAGLDAEGYALTTVAVDCERPAWIAAYSDLVFFPAGAGGVQVYQIGVGIVATYDAVAQRIDVALVDEAEAILYLFDGARGVVIPATIGTASLAFEPEVAAGCLDPVGASIGTGYIVVAHAHRLTLLSLADRLAPTLLGYREVPDYTIAAVANVGPSAWWIATERRYADQADRFDYNTIGAVFIPGSGLYALSGFSGRLIGEGDFTSLPPSYVVPGTGDDGGGGGGGVVTFYLLTEAAEPIDLEDVGRVLQEAAP